MTSNGEKDIANNVFQCPAWSHTLPWHSKYVAVQHGKSNCSFFVNLHIGKHVVCLCFKFHAIGALKLLQVLWPALTGAFDRIVKRNVCCFVMTVPLRPQTRHIAAKTVDSISIFLTPASYAFLRYSNLSSGEKEQRAPSSRPWPTQTQNRVFSCFIAQDYRSIADDQERWTYLRRSRGCTWCFRSRLAGSSAQRSTAAARWPLPRPARCSWWWLYPEPPVRTGGGRRNPPLCLWPPLSLVPDLQSKPQHSCSNKPHT